MALSSLREIGRCAVEVALVVADAVHVSDLLWLGLCDHFAEHKVFIEQLGDVVDLAMVLALAVMMVITSSLGTVDGALVFLPVLTIMVPLLPLLPMSMPVDGTQLLRLFPLRPTMMMVDGVVRLLLFLPLLPIMTMVDGVVSLLVPLPLPLPLPLLPRRMRIMADGLVSPKSTVLLLHPLPPSRNLYLPMTTVDGVANQRRLRLLVALAPLLSLHQKRNPSPRKMMVVGVTSRRRSRRLLRLHLRPLRSPRRSLKMADGVEGLKRLSDL